MGTEQGSFNSTRLSLDIADLPLTPFGMSPSGSSKRRQICPSQRINKLSLKTLKPLQEENQVLDFQREAKGNKIASSYSRILLEQSSETPGPSDLETLYEEYSSDLSDAVDERDSQCLEGIKPTVDGKTKNATLTNDTQNHRNSTEESNNRESILTDIDDGSFIEFCHGKEKGCIVPKVNINQATCIPQLYYTCESQNETQYSTSTKKDSALVGFRKYVETVRRKKGFQNTVEDSKIKMFKRTGGNIDFTSDETIITCSADMQKYQSEDNERRAISSTMIEQVPNQVQISFPGNFSDILALTVETEVLSPECKKPMPVMSPEYLHKKYWKNINQNTFSKSSDEENSETVIFSKNQEEIIISESSDDDSSESVICSKNQKEIIISESSDDENSESVICSKNQKGIIISESSDDENSKSDICSRNQKEITISESSDDDNSENVVRSRNQIKENSNCKEARVDENNAFSQQQTVVWSQEASNSLISEDISLVNSSPPTRHQLQKPKRNIEAHPTGQFSSGLEEMVVHSAVEEYAKEEQLVCEYEHNANDLDYDADCEEYKALGGRRPEKPRVVMPENAKSPAVAKWIISSPFKDSSFDTSFLQSNDSTDISETPSQPKAIGVSEPYQILKKSPNYGCWRDLKESKKMSYCVSKAKKSPRNMHSSSSSCSNSSPSENYVKTKKYSNSCWVVESSSEESGDINRERMPKSRMKQTSDLKKSLSSPKHGCFDELVEKSSEMSEDMKLARKSTMPDNVGKLSEDYWEKSLHLRLSEGLSISNKTSEKTTCGRDATSPGILKMSPVGGSHCNSSSKQKSRFIRKDFNSKSNDYIQHDKGKNINLLSPSDTSLADNKIHPDDQTSTLSQQTKSSSMKPKENIHASGNEINDILDLKKIQEELDELYSSEWRKNESSVLKCVTNENKSSVRKKMNIHIMANSKTDNTERPIKIMKEKIKKRLCFETDDEEDTFFSDLSENTSEDDDVPNFPMRKSKTEDESYRPPSDTGDDSDDDSFEVYLKSVKRQIKVNKKLENDSVGKFPPQTHLKNSFIPGSKLDSKVCGSISKDFKNRKDFGDSKKKIGPITSSSSWRDSPVVEISSDSDSDEVFSLTEVKNKPFQPSLPFVTPKLKGLGKFTSKTEGHFRQVSRKYDLYAGIDVTSHLSFLASLSANVNVSLCHPEALSYIKNFKRVKENLSEKLYRYYNTHVFENKLPSVMNIKWNARMTKTAGFCYYQIDQSKPNGRGARIELSTKVIDAPERLRDTLIHELCHAAAWIISGYKAGHGPLWKAWAAKATHTFPELPTISRCHSYEISCKYTYRCTKCSYSIGRHSKSLDTEKKVCGYCFGKFELVVNSKQRGRREMGNGSVSEKSKLNTPYQVPLKSPRTPGVFAMFVKENYGSVKKSGQNLKHAEVMKILSADFGKMKSTSN